MTYQMSLLADLTMPSRMRAASDTMDLPTCWECENAADHGVVVVIRGPSATVGRLTLCGSCVTAYYAPLAADPELAGLLSIQEELHPAC
jgi:hypothetical protein